MPKQRITKEMVIKAAFDLAREGGMEQVLVKNIAEKLQCSVQPVYGYCKNMEGLRQEVVLYTGKFIAGYVKDCLERANSEVTNPQIAGSQWENSQGANRFRSTGLAYAQFAREEPYLYRLYFLRQRKSAHSIDEVFKEEANPAVAREIANTLEIPLAQAEHLHVHMMIYNVGLSFILTTLGRHTNPEQAVALLSEAQQAFFNEQIRANLTEHNEKGEKA